MSATRTIEGVAGSVGMPVPALARRVLGYRTTGVPAVDLEVLRQACLDMPDAVEEHPFGPGALVFKVAGKMFALIGENAEPVTISLKCDPDIAASLRATHDAVAPGYHLNKRHWITVTLDGSVDDQVAAWIEDSWDLVVDGLPRSVRDELRGSGI